MVNFLDIIAPIRLPVVQRLTRSRSVKNSLTSVITSKGPIIKRADDVAAPTAVPKEKDDTAASSEGRVTRSRIHSEKKGSNGAKRARTDETSSHLLGQTKHAKVKTALEKAAPPTDGVRGRKRSAEESGNETTKRPRTDECSDLRSGRTTPVNANEDLLDNTALNDGTRRRKRSDEDDGNGSKRRRTDNFTVRCPEKDAVVLQCEGSAGHPTVEASISLDPRDTGACKKDRISSEPGEEDAARRASLRALAERVTRKMLNLRKATEASKANLGETTERADKTEHGGKNSRLGYDRYDGTLSAGSDKCRDNEAKVARDLHSASKAVIDLTGGDTILVQDKPGVSVRESTMTDIKSPWVLTADPIYPECHKTPTAEDIAELEKLDDFISSIQEPQPLLHNPIEFQTLSNLLDDVRLSHPPPGGFEPGLQPKLRFDRVTPAEVHIYPIKLNKDYRGWALELPNGNWHVVRPAFEKTRNISEQEGLVKRKRELTWRAWCGEETWSSEPVAISRGWRVKPTAAQTVVEVRIPAEPPSKNKRAHDTEEPTMNKRRKPTKTKQDPKTKKRQNSTKTKLESDDKLDKVRANKRGSPVQATNTGRPVRDRKPTRKFLDYIKV